MTCLFCGRPVDANTTHTFEDPASRTIERFCRDHCPRCKPAVKP